MTDEETARESWWNDNNCSGAMSTQKIYECGFLAGLKAGRPEWHDLRKDPNDLPSCNDLVLFKTDVSSYIGKIDYSKKLWWTGFCLDDSISNGFVIAWCEIPKYSEEPDK